MKYPDWQKRLINELQAAKKRPFLWGEHDCALFAADCVKSMCGEDYAALYRGTYNSETGAKKALLKNHGSLEKALSDYLDEIPVKLAQRGDVAIIENNGRRCAGIIWSGGVCAAGVNGLVLIKTKPLSVWRIR